MLPLLQPGHEIHLESPRQFRRGPEGEAHVLAQHLRNVRLGDLHALRQLALVHAQLLHPAEYAPEKGRADVINCP